MASVVVFLFSRQKHPRHFRKDLLLVLSKFDHRYWVLIYCVDFFIASLSALISVLQNFTLLTYIDGC